MLSQRRHADWVTTKLRRGPRPLLLVVEDILNEATCLLCVATRDGGRRDPGG